MVMLRSRFIVRRLGIAWVTTRSPQLQAALSPAPAVRHRDRSTLSRLWLRSASVGGPATTTSMLTKPVSPPGDAVSVIRPLPAVAAALNVTRIWRLAPAAMVALVGATDTQDAFPVAEQAKDHIP